MANLHQIAMGSGTDNPEISSPIAFSLISEQIKAPALSQACPAYSQGIHATEDNCAVRNKL